MGKNCSFGGARFSKLGSKYGQKFGNKTHDQLALNPFLHCIPKTLRLYFGLWVPYYLTRH